MAVVLALVIVGWLFAIALGSRVGFEEQATVLTQPQPAIATVEFQSSVSSTTAYRTPVSAS